MSLCVSLLSSRGAACTVEVGRTEADGSHTEDHGCDPFGYSYYPPAPPVMQEDHLLVRYSALSNIATRVSHCQWCDWHALNH